MFQPSPQPIESRSAFVYVELADASAHATLAAAFNAEPTHENARRLLGCVVYYGQSVKSPSARWQGHKMRSDARRRIIVVWRFAADGERVCGGLSAGEESLIGEFALKALSSAFHASCASKAGLGDSITWLNNMCCELVCDDALRARMLTAVVAALARGAYVVPSNIGDLEALPLFAQPPTSTITLRDLPASTPIAQFRALALTRAYL